MNPRRFTHSARVCRTALAIAALVGATAAPAQTQGRRPLNVDDLFQVRDVRDPQRSPDGKWVAYTLTRAFADTDKNDTDVWMVSWDASEQVQLTFSPEAESRPRWSPDGKYLSFVSSRQGAKGGQIWLLNRAGGEAVKLTEVKGGVSDYAWSPDSTRLVLVVDDPDPQVAEAEAAAEKAKDGPAKTPKPIVVDRYRFKADRDGFLRGERSHLYLFDLQSKKARPLTRRHSTTTRRPGRLTAGRSRSSAVTQRATTTRRRTATSSSSRPAKAPSRNASRARRSTKPGA